MADILDRVTQMQNQGMSPEDINRNLRNEGFSPQQIDDALSQSQVKSAVSQSPEFAQEQQTMQNMQQSIMPQQPPYQQDSYAQTKISEPSPPAQYPEGSQEYYYPETPQAYPQESYYPEASIDTETITEIAEQVVMEKLEKINKKFGNIPAFKIETKEKINNIDERLKKIETSIEKLQQAIIGKIGEFGESTEAVHKDLANLHNTVSKLMNPLIDNYKELKKLTKNK